MVAPAYRYPDNDSVPEYLRGKTAEDAAQLLQGLVEGIGRGQQQAASAPPPLETLAQDEFVTRGHLTEAQNAALAQVNPWLQTVADQQATMGYNIVKKQEEDVFRKYEPEIIKVLQRVPRAQWTLDVIGNAVTFVKGNHVQELVTDKVRALEATMGTMRSTGRAGSPSDFQAKETIAERLEKVPPSAWQLRAKAAGITDAEVRELCSMNDITPDDFFAQFGPGLITDAVADRGKS
jgi:hypothetical protein